MNFMARAVPPASTRLAPRRGLIQRCGGIDCPPGACDHAYDMADAPVRRSADATAAPAASGRNGVPASVLRVLETPGNPLEAPVRTEMEARLGHDFSRVRIHTGDEAARSARHIQAQAYTFGSHVVMGADRFQPHTSAGRLLLIHELTHVFQQAGASQPLLPTSLSEREDASEREAADRARAVATGPVQPEFRSGQASAPTAFRAGTAAAASAAGDPIRIQRQCDPAMQSCLPEPASDGPTSKNPGDLSDAELASEFQRVLREDDPATQEYLQALQTEAKQRMIQRIRSSPASDPGIAAAAGAIATSGGPYHPPEGVSLSCSVADDCSTLSLKINYLLHTIASHIAWDKANPMPGWPQGRHAQEIAELTNAVENCKAWYTTKCTNQPKIYPPPVVVLPEQVPETASEGAEATEAVETAETLEAAETVEVGVEAAEGLELLELVPFLLL